MKAPFKLVALTLLALATAAAWPAGAEEYPNKPVRIISDSAPGSAVDVTFRMVMDWLGTEVNAFVNAQQVQWRPVLEALEASVEN